ncbi:LiaF transmembrane domain-containing protein [Marinoscillum furvescens]|uniref:Putative membrane protein n=1 Tax=Marinoscillum furvescens DSM 4134 TaxID=1122208 RepID=A0A3D9L3J1_MARFU|nr:LiaF domain-containing protein [Marinoscillum furvescens]RED98972.1 putative membrane protein [Marinoscillum furvescens DSM 4134]
MKSNRKAFFGIILVLIGILLLLENLNILPDIPRYVFSWTQIFLLLAIVNLASGNRSGALIFALLWGFFFTQQHTPYSVADYWPVLLIILGLSFVFKSKGSPQRSSDDSFFDEVNVFGGSTVQITSQTLNGGKVTNVFGGGTVDLLQAKADDGTVIEVTNIFGGCDLLVPQDWNVTIDTTNIFGGFEDKRPSPINTSGPKVYIRGHSIFGGGDMKSSK